jgi:DNA-binding NarL/FixJ family response regulator
MQETFLIDLHSAQPDPALERIAGAGRVAYHLDRSLQTAQAEKTSTIIIEHRLLVRQCLIKLIEGVVGEGCVQAFASVADWLASELVDLSNLLFLISTADHPESEIASDITSLGQICPNCRIVLLSDEEDLGRILWALRQGVHGYIPTSLSLDVAVEVLHLVRAGGTFVPASSILSTRTPDVGIDIDIPTLAPLRIDVGLTARQTAVLDALRQGKPNKMIANELNLCESTVKIHVRNIMKKMHAKNRTEIAFRVNNANGTGNGH